MYIQLIREGFTDKATEGKLFVNGTEECYTLEDMGRKLEDGGEKVYGETCIPRGIYEIKLTMSNRFKKILPELINVPQFTGIRIHPGNKAEDSHGCILVGTTNTSNTDNWIGGSRVAFDKLMQQMIETKELGEDITIEIT